MTDDMAVFDMTIARLLRALSGYYPSWDGDLCDALLARFKLDATRRVGALSKGDATRIRLVIAMSFAPRLLVLDEPATGLDVGGRRALLSSVLEVVRSPERSVVISSHQIADLERIADRLIVIDQGRVIEQGQMEELVAPGQTLEEALLEWGAAG